MMMVFRLPLLLPPVHVIFKFQRRASRAAKGNTWRGGCSVLRTRWEVAGNDLLSMFLRGLAAGCCADGDGMA
jgi:hypothetical protein